MDQPLTSQTEPRNERRTRGRKRGLVRLQAKHSLATRWFHWINFPVLGIMVWSGLMIYWANRAYHVGSFSLFPDSWYAFPGLAGQFAEKHHWPKPLTAELPGSMDSRLAEGMGWHFLFMWVFAINGLAYVLYTAFSGAWRDLLPKRGTFRESIHVVLHDLFLVKAPPPKAKFNAAQRIAYTGIVLMGLGSLVTGVMVYKPTQAAWLSAPIGGYQNARFVHFWLTMGFLAFFVVHVSQVVRAGWNNFRAMVTGYELAPIDEVEK